MTPDQIPPATEHLLDSEELAALIRAATGDGYTISLNAPGGSMRPFIRSGDKIFIAPVDQKSIRVGDILAFVRTPDGHVLAHRVVKLRDVLILCKGDNIAEHDDGWIQFEDVLGRVLKVQRDGQPVWLGPGLVKRLIARLSRRNKLVPLVSSLRRVKWGIISLFPSKDKSKS